jgi:hypothetical protein
MRVHTNPRLYGGEFLNDIENYFDIYQQDYIINTWKVLVEHKSKDRFGYLGALTPNRKRRFENLLWRKWHMNSRGISKVYFNMGLIPQSELAGPLVIM